MIGRYVRTSYNAADNVTAFKKYKVVEDVAGCPVIWSDGPELLIQNPDSNLPCEHLNGKGVWSWVPSKPE